MGRVSIGLGLMLLALNILLPHTCSGETAPGARVVRSAVTGDPVLCILIAAAVTLVIHFYFSVASALLTMSLAYSHFISAAVALVLDANLGSAINPVIEGGRRDNTASYCLPLGNLINRLIGVALVLPFIYLLRQLLHSVQPLAKVTVMFHVAFNLSAAGPHAEHRVHVISEKAC